MQSLLLMAQALPATCLQAHPQARPAVPQPRPWAPPTPRWQLQPPPPQGAHQRQEAPQRLQDWRRLTGHQRSSSSSRRRAPSLWARTSASHQGRSPQLQQRRRLVQHQWLWLRCPSRRRRCRALRPAAHLRRHQTQWRQMQPQSAQQRRLSWPPMHMRPCDWAVAAATQWQQATRRQAPCSLIQPQHRAAAAQSAVTQWRRSGLSRRPQQLLTDPQACSQQLG